MESLAYDEIVWEEMLDGKIVAMSPRPVVNHNVVVTNISRIFGNYLKGKTCIAFSDGVDVYMTEKDRVIPDVMIVCNRSIIKKDGVYGTPDLIVEVLSHSTAKRDKGYKKSLYEKCGVKEYWIVDAESRLIDVNILEDGRYVLDEVYSIFPDYVVEKMTEDEKNGILKEFTTSLFPDMKIVVEDVFENVL